MFSRDALVREVTISNPKGCHLIPWALEEKAYVSPGAPDLVPLPPEGLTLQRMAGEEGPPSSLAMQGVRLWMTPEGLYARRQCQESVYWKEGVSPYKDKLNEMEREVNCKVLDTQDFLTGQDEGQSNCVRVMMEPFLNSVNRGKDEGGPTSHVTFASGTSQAYTQQHYSFTF